MAVDGADLQSMKHAILDLMSEFERLHEMAVEPIERLRRQQSTTTNSSIFDARESLIVRRKQASSKLKESIEDLKQLLGEIECELNKDI